MRWVYLDHSATTPVRPEVAEAMWPYFSNVFGNPSSLHRFGRDAREALFRARQSVAAALGAEPEEIVFTSSATEANNLAIRGFMDRYREAGGQIITTGIEHSAVLEVVRQLGREGFRADILPVDSYGKVHPADLEKVLTDRTRLVSIMLGNNETGVIQNLAPFVRLAQSKGALFHTDAVQAIGKIPVDADLLGVDFLSVSGHKIGAPKGVGALYVRKGRELVPQLLGGGHEKGLRSGTENVPGIVGLARAMELAVEELETVPPEMRRLRDILKGRLGSEISHLTVNSDCIECLPHTLSVCIAGVLGSDLVEALDRKGVAVSSGSACHVGERKVSHVLHAMGVPEETAAGSLRLSLGWDTTEEDVLYAADRIREVVTLLRGQESGQGRSLG